MFGFGDKRFIGIDIGTSNIKIAELRVVGNKPVLANYAWVRLDGMMGDQDLKTSYFDTFLPEYIKRMLKESGIKGRDVNLSIPAFGGLITLIEFPEMVKDDLDQAIKFEAHKYIPTSLDDVVLSWDIVSRKNTGKALIKNSDTKEVEAGSATVAVENKIQVLLVAAPKSRVIKYENLSKEVGLKLKSIEIESFSLVRSLIGNDQGNFMIIDIGSRVCNIILVEKGVIKANRNIDAGGRDISRALAKSMNIDEARADRLKMSEKNFLSGEANMNFPVLDLVIGEALRVLGAYYKGAAGASLDGIILSGGTAGLKGIEEYFSKALNIKVMVGNSLSRIEYDKRLEPKVREIQDQFSVSIGLALKGFEEHLGK